MKVELHPYSLIHVALIKLQNENTQLKKQIEEMKLEKTSESVSEKIDQWLSRSYQGISERDDIERFAIEITNYIRDKLKT